MKRVFALCLILLAASLAMSQTTVTLQVTDADSQTWNLGSFTVALTSALASYPVGGNAALITSTLSASGAASMTLQAGTYTFKTCPAAVAVSSGTFGSLTVPCYATSVAVSGGSQTVTLAPPAIRIALPVVGVAVKAYADAEVTGATVGAKYYNLSIGADRYWNGTVWSNVGGPLFAVVQKAETTTADASVMTYTPPALAGGYRVCYAADVASATAGVVSFTLRYVDSAGTTIADVAQSLTQSGVGVPAVTYTTSAAHNYGACAFITINNSATPIILKWVGGGTISANVSASIERMLP